MPNHLERETSPYLRQHAHQPVDWYPWGEAAFAKARKEDKPVFLSIGYSTCHWCHVMARESFEDESIAALLNQYFISVKVDREERPDIDHIYLRVCEAFTGSGGWPATIFMTPDLKPFFAGAYFPKRSGRGMIGLRELILLLHEKWETEREDLLAHADRITALMNRETQKAAAPSDALHAAAVQYFKTAYDRENGGFGPAPKFPLPHQLIYLLSYGRRFQDNACIDMALKTLTQLCRGGIHDAVGGGFCRYSTDERFLVPHFEKMLYDNALMILALCRAHDAAEDERASAFYLHFAEKTAAYILREMTSPEGGFYSAQDADADGQEGKYYLFAWEELKRLVPAAVFPDFCQHFGAAPQGNFERRILLNCLESDPMDGRFDDVLKTLYAYRRKRYALRRDEKILTGWNGLAIAAFCALYRISGHGEYLLAARRADSMIHNRLTRDGRLLSSFTAGQCGPPAFLDDCAAYILAQIALYEATLEAAYLRKAENMCQTALEAFYDREKGGFYFRADGQEALLTRTKETDDGALPSGNAMMAWNLARLALLTGRERYASLARSQLDYLRGEAAAFPTGHTLFLCTLLIHEKPPLKVLLVSEHPADAAGLPLRFPADTALAFQMPSAQYPLLNGKAAYYLCDDGRCYPPANETEALKASPSGQ